jgi:carbamoyltransferase
MNILSISRVGHDSSFCIINEIGKLVLYRMEERFSRKKHDFGFKFSLKNLNKLQIYIDKVYITNHYLDNFLCPLSIILNNLKFLDDDKIKISSKNHHLYHSYCGFYNSNFLEALCFSLDGSGMFFEDIKDNKKYIETESIFYLNKENKEKNKILYKKYRLFQENDEVYYYTELCSNNKIIKIDNQIEIKNEESLGEKFAKFSEEVCNFSHHDAGKVMGLAQYNNHKDKLQYPYSTKEWKERVNGAYDLQQETQNHVLNLIKKYTEETGVKNVVISGGYGLNCVANYHYLKNLKDINLYIDPICFDAGISIGAAYYHYLQSSQNSFQIQPLQNVYIGHQEETYDLKNLQTQKVSYEDITNLILQKNIVALFQGKSEAGQRALGNRSLLFDPRVPDGKDLVNQIKKRENFRPFAGSILQEEASKWFNMLSLKESPYMQYAMDAYNNAIEQVPAIIHADNTCRIQTVTEEQNSHFYNLISCFFEKTGVPMLLNTSFNLGGEPLVETFEHAIYTLKNSMIEYLYLPEIETLVTIKNKKLMYQ